MKFSNKKNTRLYNEAKADFENKRYTSALKKLAEMKLLIESTRDDVEFMPKVEKSITFLLSKNIFLERTAEAVNSKPRSARKKPRY
ncbi:MAG: hypothetical protein AB7I18_11545 [Candidatus Berkiella sp.]